MSRIIGITGKSCCGKNHIAQLLEKRGWECIDVDAIGHEALDEAAIEVEAAFNLPHEEKIDRRMLGRIVFADSGKLKTLERIIHPRMAERVKAMATASKAPFVAINAAILHRMKLDRICDAIIYVKAPFRVRFMRARRRDGISFNDFVARSRSQKDVNSRNFQKGKRVIVLSNVKNEKEINRQIDRICDRLS
ncbi:MAG: dephospho-CoA kinase [Sphaerochaetaceae bacterium]